MRWLRPGQKNRYFRGVLEELKRKLDSKTFLEDFFKNFLEDCFLKTILDFLEEFLGAQLLKAISKAIDDSLRTVYGRQCLMTVYGRQSLMTVYGR